MESMKRIMFIGDLKADENILYTVISMMGDRLFNLIFLYAKDPFLLTFKEYDSKTIIDVYYSVPLHATLPSICIYEQKGVVVES